MDLQFYPDAMQEEADRLQALALTLRESLEDLRKTPSALRGQLGEENALPDRLSALLLRCEETIRQLSALSAGVREAAGIYDAAERALNRQAEALPAPGLQCGRGGGSSPATPPVFGRSAAQLTGGFLVDDWLARLLVDEERIF